MGRHGTLAFGILCYAAFVAVFAVTICFVSDVGLTKTIDAPLQEPGWTALAGNLALLGLFAAQHSIMARQAFKRRWTRIVPPPLERSSYVLVSSLLLAAVFWLWQPLGPVLYEIRHPVGRVALHALLACGWLLVLVATMLIHYADLFGLHQVWARFRGQPYYPPRFVIPGPYRLVRHPLYLGWLLAFWATPRLTLGHLVFASFFTVYVVFAIVLEERDLLRVYGYKYANYRSRVPMLLPFLRRLHPVRRRVDGAVRPRAR